MLQVTGVRKKYQGLRPLRLSHLTIAEGERVAVSGLDAAGAEVFVNLVTGASVPDEGDVRVPGESTAAIENGDAWLTSLDRFGIVSPRAVLLDGASLVQNLAMPFSLEIDPIPPDVLGAPARLRRPTASTMPLSAAGCGARPGRPRSGASRPCPCARSCPPGAGAPHRIAAARRGARLRESVARVADDRRIATLIISDDADFTAAAASRRLTLNAGTGELRSPRRS